MRKPFSIECTPLKGDFNPPLWDGQSGEPANSLDIARDGCDWDAQIFMLLPQGIWKVVIRGTDNKMMHTPGNGTFLAEKHDDYVVIRKIK